MPATVKRPLGASTVNRKWYLDVDTSTTGTPTWVGVFGIQDFTPGAIDANTEDDSDFDSGGYGSVTKTAESWSLELTVGRKVQADDQTAYDPGQEFLRLKSIGTFGVANSVRVRWYEMEPNGPRVEAYEGNAAVVYNNNGGAHSALSTATITLTGQGAMVPVAHPDDA